MPTIFEEEETAMNANQHQDFSDLLALPELDLGATSEQSNATTQHPSHTNNLCPSHPGDDCLCYGFITDLDQFPPTSTGNVPEPDYAAFEQWIPRFVRPENPCDYCRFKRLQCYLGAGETSCTSCQTLFRSCSLTNSNTLEARNYADKPQGEFLDTLHSVDEDTARQWGTLTGIKELRSKPAGSGTVTPVGQDDGPGSSKRNGTRFPRAAIKVLKDWLDVHQDHPYPSEEEKAELERRTELTPTQIANWLANARRRRKVANRSRPKIAMSPSLRPTTPAMAIPCADKPWDELNPLERWKHSPPANEPAAIADIANAVAHTEFDEDHEPASPSSYGKHKGSSSGFSGHRAPSTTSIEASSNSVSGISSGANSHGSSHGSFGSFSSSLAGKKGHRRRRRQAASQLRNPNDSRKRMFQCTFCTDTFKSKYDWTRHEKSLHLSLEKWLCCPLGPKLADPHTGVVKCAYCNLEDPSNEHLEFHNHSQCEEKGLDARVFFRKDHLRQHLRLMHGCEMITSMDAWKSIAAQINSRCGFCGQRFTQWGERVDHLTIHFRAGARMSEWRGCRGLDPAVAAQVTNAMPPYLIGMESLSPDPFSAIKSSHTAHVNLVTAQGEDINNSLSPLQRQKIAEDASRGSKSTCWEILTVRLGKYANEMVSKGVVMTDEMLQRQARILLFDSDDPWNQTAADNPEWLDLFRKAHGLDFIPSQVGGQGAQVPTDLETYGDLGLRIPFVVQLQAYNKEQHRLGQRPGGTSCKPLSCAQDLEQTHRVVKTFYGQLAEAGLLHRSTDACAHPECRLNVVDLNALEPSGEWNSDPHKLWCTYELPLDQAALLGRARSNNNVNTNIPSDPNDPPVPTSGGSGGDVSQQPRTQPFTPLSYPRDSMSRDEAAPPNDQAPYFPRYRYELPPDRATRFEFTTPAWPDSGQMPAPVATSTLLTQQHQQQHQPATGAMMGHLDSGVGQSTSPSHDVATCTTATTADDMAMAFPVEGIMNEVSSWDLGPGYSGLVDQRVLQELDGLIASSSSSSLGDEGGMVSSAGLRRGGLGDVGMSWDCGVMGGSGGYLGTEQGQGQDLEFSFDDMVFDFGEEGVGGGR